jgi:hypothetical protein
MISALKNNRKDFSLSEYVPCRVLYMQGPLVTQRVQLSFTAAPVLLSA